MGVKATGRPQERGGKQVISTEWRIRRSVTVARGSQVIPSRTCLQAGRVTGDDGVPPRLGAGAQLTLIAHQ